MKKINFYKFIRVFWKMKKKYRYIIFLYFPVAGTKKKKKKCSSETVFGLLPKLYGEKKIVLQENECIVREQLLGCQMGCRKKKIVLQYIKLYCNRKA